MANTKLKSTVKVNIKWVNEKQVRMQFASAANNLDNTVLPLVAARALVIESVETRFRTKTDPSGKAWPEWSKKYVPAYRQTRASGMLTQTDELKDAMLDPGSYPIRGDALFLESKAIQTHYGEKHQRGYYGEARPQLPQRQFVDTSKTGVLTREIVKIFVRWANNSIRIFERRGQIIQQNIQPGSSLWGKGKITKLL